MLAWLGDLVSNYDGCIKKMHKGNSLLATLKIPRKGSFQGPEILQAANGLRASETQVLMLGENPT